ncbi:MAG: helix-turn-helix transcriptional regulator [Bacteroidales bacterium]
MQNRLQKILDSEQLTPAKFAEILGVQRSAISHIITGRNNPSFDLISKIIHKFPALNSDWLITGKGNMYKTVVQGSLFDFDTPKTSELPSKNIEPNTEGSIVVTDVNNNIVEDKNTLDTSVKNIIESQRKVKKIVVFYTDNTFEEFISTP